ncbi:hypothetical protein [Dietzia sp. UBA5065]|uniref:hypothetical protein n=1 Tax=Dietzia sp. UBA5065 TaxID=1946422 RepID=UPI0025C5A5EF|nr:hypothetical protein [Dietzia sp. UBA5065]HMT49305.1 hypothetical protein [Dietzia sp.]
MGKFDPAARVRGLALAFQDRHGRRARALAARLEEYDDDELVIRPWEFRLPRVVILAAARARGLEPVGGVEALVGVGPWTEPMRFTRAADR